MSKDRAPQYPPSKPSEDSTCRVLSLSHSDICHNPPRVMAHWPMGPRSLVGGLPSISLSQNSGAKTRMQKRQDFWSAIIISTGQGEHYCTLRTPFPEQHTKILRPRVCRPCIQLISTSSTHLWKDETGVRSTLSLNPFRWSLHEDRVQSDLG